MRRLACNELLVGFTPVSLIVRGMSCLRKWMKSKRKLGYEKTIVFRKKRTKVLANIGRSALND